MRIKVVDVNIWQGGLLMDELAAFLQQESPDVLLMQEVFNEHDETFEPSLRSVDVLQGVTGLSHAAFEPAYREVLPTGRYERGTAVLSRWPIVSSRAVFFDVPYDDNFVRPERDHTKTPRCVQHTVVEASDGALNVFNNHGIWGFDGDDTPRRIAMAETIVREIGDLEHLIVGGDFNVQEGTKTMRMLGERLHDVFAGERTSSFNMRQKDNPGYAGAVVDFVFVSDDFRVLRHEQPDVDVSDHYPLVVELEMV